MNNDGFADDDLQDLYEHAPCGYVSTLPDGTFVRINQTFLHWLGYESATSLIGKRFQNILPISGKIYHETHLLPLLQIQGYVNEVAFEVLRQDGTRMPVMLNVVQRNDVSGGTTVHRMAIFRTSDRRQYERELQLARKEAEQALNLRDQFLSLASHELKTPLTTILGHMQLLQRRLVKSDVVTVRDHRAIQTLVEQTERLSQMVLSLFDISRIESGQLTVDRLPMDIAALARQVVADVQTTLETHTIGAQIGDEPAIVLGDALRLEQVLQNLVQNALKYSPPLSTIVVSLTVDGGIVRFAVQDHGIGIPADSLPQLFERFYRASNAEQQNISGMGIGLYVVKEIIRLHDGTVQVISVEGQGSTFAIEIPCCLPSEPLKP